MRRFALLPLAVLAAAACQDQPAAPEAAAPDAPALARGGRSAPPITVSQPRSLAYTEGDVYRYHNRPEPDIGGDHVVWRYMADPYYGPVQVHQVRLSTGAATQLAELDTYAAPHTSGRYTTWQDGLTGIAVLDNLSGTRRRIEGVWPWAQSVDIAGDRLVFIDQNGGARKVVLYDIGTGQQRTLVVSGPGTPYNVLSVGFDGRYVAWIAEARAGMSYLGLVVYDLATGQEHLAVPMEHTRMTGPSLDRGRVVFSMDVGDRQSVFLYDASRATLRRISDAPGAQQYPEISGDWIVWEDTRQDANPAYVYNYDVYLYDLRTRVEVPLASGPEWTSAPQIDGSRVVWTERRNNRWEVMLVELSRGRHGPPSGKARPGGR